MTASAEYRRLRFCRGLHLRASLFLHCLLDGEAYVSECAFGICHELTWALKTTFANNATGPS